MSNKSIVILGASGSVGMQALDVARTQGHYVEGISGGSRIDILENIIREFSPKYCAVANEEKAKDLKIAIADTETKIISGTNSSSELVKNVESHTVVNSVSGFAGLLPTIETIKCKKRLALANKESLVTAGDIVMPLAKEYGSEILPVDSEHCAIHQCLAGKRAKKIIITASGGPFFGKEKKDLENVTPAIALNHPTWSMGKKITIDSATLMNKGFEVIEAAHLYDMNADEIEVVVHKESIIHSMVEFEDGAIIAQLSNPDMRLCASYAINYPDRANCGIKPMDFSTLKSLSFGKPDMNTFNLLGLAYDVLRKGGIYGAVMNAVNEIAVERFFNGTLSFLGIMDMVAELTLSYPNIKNPSIEDIIQADKESRIIAREYSK